MYDIKIYETENGKSEIKEYLRRLKSQNNKDSKTKFKKITAYIRMLKNYGLSLGEPYIKRISSEIWELRPLRDRILFASLQNNKFILLSIFMKETNKTPKREKEKAQKLLKEYKRRFEK